MDAVAVVGEWTQGAVRGENRVELWHPDAEIVNARGWVMETTYRGRAGVGQWWQDIAEVFSDFAWVLDSLEGVDSQHVLTRQRFTGRFQASGIDAGDMPWWSVFTVRDGMIVRAVGYLTRREALDALGQRAS